MNQKGVNVVILANIAAWFLGTFASFYVRVYLYIFVFVANVCLGVAIFVFHTMGNPRVSLRLQLYLLTETEIFLINLSKHIETFSAIC